MNLAGIYDNVFLSHPVTESLSGASATSGQSLKSQAGPLNGFKKIICHELLKKQ